MQTCRVSARGILVTMLLLLLRRRLRLRGDGGGGLTRFRRRLQTERAVEGVLGD